jgi:probable HAF family extracellular repeat protein
MRSFSLAAIFLPTLASPLFGAAYSVSTVGYLSAPNPLTGGTYIQNSGLQLNNLGEVMGNYVQPGGPAGSTFHGFRTAPNSAFNPTTDDIGSIGNDQVTYSIALSLNNKGEVLGDTFTSDGQTPLVFRTDSSGKISGDALNLGNIGATFLNDREQVAGSEGSIAFRTQPGKSYNPATDNLPTAHLVQIFALNNRGQLLGQDISTNDYFRTTPDGPIDLTVDSLGPNFGGRVLNDLGQVAGGVLPSHDVFLTAPDQTAPNGIDFGKLPEGFSSPLDANDLGSVVGDATTSTPGFTAFVTLNGQVVDLNGLIDPELGIFLTDAVQINDVGQILAYTAGTPANPAGSVVLLTPVPEPASLALILLPAPLLLRRRRSATSLPRG